MNSIDLLENLGLVDPVCVDISLEMKTIEDAYTRGDLTAEERTHLISEIRDIRAAEICAGNEVAMRHLVQVCNLLLSVI